MVGVEGVRQCYELSYYEGTGDRELTFFQLKVKFGK
jgi:hypothetical protein